MKQTLTLVRAEFRNLSLESLGAPLVLLFGLTLFSFLQNILAENALQQFQVQTHGSVAILSNFITLAIFVSMAGHAFHPEKITYLTDLTSCYPTSLKQLYLSKILTTVYACTVFFAVSGVTQIGLVLLHHNSTDPQFQDVQRIGFETLIALVALLPFVIVSTTIALFAPFHWLIAGAWVLTWGFIRDKSWFNPDFAPPLAVSTFDASRQAIPWTFWVVILYSIGLARFLHLTSARLRGTKKRFTFLATPFARWLLVGTPILSILVAMMVTGYREEADISGGESAFAPRQVIESEHLVIQLPNKSTADLETVASAADYLFVLIATRLQLDAADPVVVDARGSMAGTLGIARQFQVNQKWSNRFSKDMRVLGHELTHVALNMLLPDLESRLDASVLSFVHEGLATLFEDLTTEGTLSQRRTTLGLQRLATRSDSRKLLERVFSSHLVWGQLQYELGAEFFASINELAGEKGLRRFLLAIGSSEASKWGGVTALDWALSQQGLSLAAVLQRLDDNTSASATPKGSEILEQLSPEAEFKNDQLVVSLGHSLPKTFHLECRYATSNSSQLEFQAMRQGKFTVHSEKGVCISDNIPEDASAVRAEISLPDDAGTYITDWMDLPSD